MGDGSRCGRVWGRGLDRHAGTTAGGERAMEAGAVGCVGGGLTDTRVQQQVESGRWKQVRQGGRGRGSAAGCGGPGGGSAVRPLRSSAHPLGLLYSIPAPKTNSDNTPKSMPHPPKYY